MTNPLGRVTGPAKEEMQGGRALPTDKDGEDGNEEEDVNDERRVEESEMAGPQEVVALEGRVENATTL